MATRPSQEPAPSFRPSLTPVSLFLVLLLFWIVTQIELVMVLGLLALLFGTILEGPVRFFQSRRFPRPAAILAVYIVILGSLALLVVAVAPGIADQASEFSDDVPGQLRELRDEWSTSENGLLSGWGVGMLDRAIETLDGEQEVSVDTDRLLPVLTSITGGLVSTVTLLVMTFYYLLEKRLLRGLILDALTPRFRTRVDGLWTEVENKVGGWMRGQLLLCLIIGTIATVAYGIIGLDFWPLLGLWAGITEIIPIVGPWIGGIPAVLIALTVSWKVTLVTIAVIVAMQSLENWVLVPRVMKGAVGLTPLTVFVAILAGTQFMGIVGAVLAIPIAATIQVILTDFLERRADRDERMTARSGWRWMLSRSGLREVDSDEEVGLDDIETNPRAVPATDDLGYVGEEGDTIAWDDGEMPDGDMSLEPVADDEVRELTGESAGPPPPARPTETGDARSFAAWPRPSDKIRKRPPSSTWPPLDEGRPERLRRPRRDTET